MAMNRLIRLAYPDLVFKEVMQPLKDIIDSGRLTKGPKTEEFEKIARRYLKVRHAIAVSSGTAALHLAFLSLGIGPGDEVIVPDFTFPATANAVELCGAKAVLADIDPESLNIDPVSIVRNITHKTRAISPVHQFGNPADMGRILDIAKKYHLYVVEDAACALGAKYKNAMCGTMGDMGCFSFHPRKIISTGEGGLIVTNDSKLDARCRQLREHGILEKKGKKVFEGLGLNYRISEISACLGIAGMNKIEKTIKNRIYMAERFRDILCRIRGISVLPKVIEEGNRCVNQSFIVFVNKSINIFDLISFLNSKKIEAAIGSIALHTQPYYAGKYHLKNKDFKNSLLAYKRSIALPFHHKITERDFIYIARALENYLNSQGG